MASLPHRSFHLAVQHDFNALLKLGDHQLAACNNYILRDAKGLRCCFLFELRKIALPFKEPGKCRVKVHNRLLQGLAVNLFL